MDKENIIDQIKKAKQAMAELENFWFMVQKKEREINNAKTMDSQAN